MTAEEEWIAQYYPVTAQEFVAQHPKPNNLLAVEHALLKWRGIRAWVRDHGWQTTPIDVSGNTCALCQYYVDVPGKDNCEGCPIVVYSGNCCDAGSLDGEVVSTWEKWSHQHRPTPMIELLELVREELIKDEEAKTKGEST